MFICAVASPLRTHLSAIVVVVFPIFASHQQRRKSANKWNFKVVPFSLLLSYLVAVIARLLLMLVIAAYLRKIYGCILSNHVICI